MLSELSTSIDDRATALIVTACVVAAVILFVWIRARPDRSIESKAKSDADARTDRQRLARFERIFGQEFASFEQLFEYLGTLSTEMSRLLEERDHLAATATDTDAIVDKNKHLDDTLQQATARISDLEQRLTDAERLSLSSRLSAANDACRDAIVILRDDRNFSELAQAVDVGGISARVAGLIAALGSDGASKNHRVQLVEPLERHDFDELFLLETLLEYALPPGLGWSILLRAVHLAAYSIRIELIEQGFQIAIHQPFVPVKKTAVVLAGADLRGIRRVNFLRLAAQESLRTFPRDALICAYTESIGYTRPDGVHHRCTVAKLNPADWD
jgi:hypothetical protein